MAECDPDLVGTIGAAQVDRPLVAHQLAAAVGEDRRTAGQTCALLLIATGRGAPESEAVREHVEDDCGAAAAERVANHGRQRIERAEAIPWREVSAVRPVGSEKQARAASGPAKRAAVATQPWPR